MSLFSFNAAGLAKFREELEALASIAAPSKADFQRVASIANEDRYKQLIEPDISLPSGAFRTRYELCKALFDKLEHSSVIRDLNPSDSVWSWLTCYYFEVLTSRQGKSKSSPFSKETGFPAYIWDANSFTKRYRHRIGHGVYMIKHLGPELSKPMLLSEPGSMSDYCEETFARIGSYRERSVIEAANSLYFDPDSERIVPGCSKNDRRWGLIHLHRQVAQYLINYELHAMSKEELLGFLDFRFQLCANPDVPAKVVAFFIAGNVRDWKDQLVGKGIKDPECLIASQLGCTKSTLEKFIKNATRQPSKRNKPRKRVSDQNVSFRDIFGKADATAVTAALKALVSPEPLTASDHSLLQKLREAMPARGRKS